MEEKTTVGAEINKMDGARGVEKNKADGLERRGTGG